MSASAARERGRVARLFGLEGDRWLRHANPASVWSRFSVLSLLALSIWSRDWIGWLCLVPVALSLAWMVLNPRVFGVPRSTRNWASKGVLGERLWTERPRDEPVPSSEASWVLPAPFRSRVPAVANAIAVLGLVLLGYGLVALAVLPVLAGLVIAHTAKLWYIDRMVLLFDDVKRRDPDVARWEW